ncbi:hypothetical protein GCM10010230_19660 [Streptomyces narbonensis]|uniref:hypothetical protein n=1 Tax=Streptomyces narbonensis TaxID=67333 RepID=UPI001673630A|nr:hypothetical protein [Streptomyces narbonensis]GGV97840.1 hypothetical protein GCM10010230_19660 [Streptomyces narbonensis]
MRAAAVFALSAGVTVPAVIHAPAAHADWTNTSGMTRDDGRYRLYLPANALWIKVSVLASTAPGAAVLASTEELTTDSSAWDTDAPITLPAGTAFGDYPVRVDYRLPGETTKKWTGGTYSFRPHIGVSGLSWNRATTSYDQRQAVLSGTTTLWDPATGTRTSAPQGTKVALKLNTYATNNYGTITATATTRADGTFSLPVTPNGTVQGGTATVVTAGTVNDPDAEVYVPSLGVDPLLYRISANVNKYRVLAGTNVQVSGHVERYTPSGWKPFAGAPVVGTGTEPSYNDSTAVNVLGGATSSATGTFSFAAKAQYSTDFVYTSLRPSAYFQSSRAFDRSDIVVPQQFTFSPYTITLDEHGTVTATGGFNGYCTVTQPVQLQASLDNGRTWRVLRSGTNDTYCGYKLVAQGYESALYRVHHPETNQFVAKSGTSLKRARTYTRFSAFTISPTRPTVNGKMTVSGTVQRKVSGVWKPLAGAKLTLVFKPRNESQWYWVTKTITTDSSGRFSYRATAYADGSWAALLNTTGTYFYSETKAVYIDAR